MVVLPLALVIGVIGVIGAIGATASDRDDVPVCATYLSLDRSGLAERLVHQHARSEG